MSRWCRAPFGACFPSPSVQVGAPRQIPCQSVFCAMVHCDRLRQVYVCKFMTASMHILPEVGERVRRFRRNPDIWPNKRAFHDQKQSSCCFDSVQQPLNERTPIWYAFTRSLSEINELHMKVLQLQKTKEAFCVRCRTAPPLCAPGSITEPMNSRERSHVRVERHPPSRWSPRWSTGPASQTPTCWKLRDPVR